MLNLPMSLYGYYLLQLLLHFRYLDLPQIHSTSHVSMSSSFPPPPLYSISTAASSAVILILLSTFHLASSYACSNSKSSSCPPFKSTLSYPFSSTPGCGHPFFQINCSSHSSSPPKSVITINKIPFSVLNYIANSSSLFLSPQPAIISSNSSLTSAQNRNCSSTHFLSIPHKSINLSGTPFKVAETSCSRLSVLKPCSPEPPQTAPNLTNCSLCEWECKIIKNPVRIFHDCGGFNRHHVSEQGCQNDVLSYLDDYLLKFGIEIEWDADQDSYFRQCRSCEDKNGVCGYHLDDKDKGFFCFQSKTRIWPPWIRQHYADRISIICTTVIFLFLLVITVMVIIIRIRKLKSISETEEDPTAVFLHHHRSPNLLPPIFTYEELEWSTNKFDLKRKIGDGGFGSVFLGNLRDGRIVAVKYLHRHPVSSVGAANRAFFTKSFCNEILILSSIDHPNLVKLHGYCSDPRGLLLVYDYVPNGTLADHLHGESSMKLLNKKNSSLKWEVRFEIALQTAIAMKYLHFDVNPSIVHRDITSSNIFIEKDMTVKIGDFGLSRLLIWDGGANNSMSNNANGCVWTGPQGTPGYLDPDYYKSFRLTEKSDVYSFGVVLLELVTGLRAVDQNRAKREVALADLVVGRIHMGLMNQVVDVDLIVNGQVMEGVSAVAELAFRCVAADKDDRPDSKEVVEELKRIGSRIGGCLTRVSSSISDVGVRGV